MYRLCLLVIVTVAISACTSFSVIRSPAVSDDDYFQADTDSSSKVIYTYTNIGTYNTLLDQIGSQFIDFHIHPSISSSVVRCSDCVKTFDSISKSKFLVNGLVISPTYSLLPWNNLSIAEIHHVNERISQKITENTHLLGLCGVPIHRTDFFEIADLCINLPKMAGFKIRNISLSVRPFEDQLNPKDPEFNSDEYIEAISKKFEKILELANKKHALVLVHFDQGLPPSSPSEVKGRLTGNLDTTKKLLDLAVKFPNAKLIIAHSGIYSFIGVNGLKYIGQFFQKHKNILRNVYLEISATIEMANPQSSDRLKAENEIVNAWRVFDTNYILFGSDYPAAKNIDLPKSLTIEERNRILLSNGRSLLSGIARVAR